MKPDNWFDSKSEEQKLDAIYSQTKMSLERSIENFHKIQGISPYCRGLISMYKHLCEKTNFPYEYTFVAVIEKREVPENSPSFEVFKGESIGQKISDFVNKVSCDGYL